MTIHGVDVSSFQPNWSPAAGDDFAIIKATEGTGYWNPYQTRQAARARAKGLVVGFYHFLHPGNIQAQAEYFVARCGSQAGDLLVCDWEYVNKVGYATGAEKDEFLRAVQKLRPTHRVGLYCNSSDWKTLDTTSFCADFLWDADYNHKGPGVAHPVLFWQYASSPIDEDRGYFASRAQLRSWAAGNEAAKPVTKPKPDPKPLPTPAPKPTPAPAPKPAPVPPAKDLIAVPDPTPHTRTKNQTFHRGDSKLLRIDDRDNVSFGFGAGTYLAVFRFAIDSLTPGQDFRVIPYHVDTDSKGKSVGKPHDYPVVGIPGTSGSTWAQIVFYEKVSAPAKGHTRRLRLRGEYSGPNPVTVTSINSNVGKA